MRHILAWVSVLVLAVSARPAWGCSVVDDYVRPSNFELVQIADAIVVATPEVGAGKTPLDGLTFRIEKTVKGTPPDRVALGMASLGQTTPSDLADLSASHPEGYAGPCNRTTFAKGGRYLLFLARDADGSWRSLGFPFARINEDYAGEDNAWMRSVRRYLRLQQSLKPMDQIAALRRMIETGRDGGSLLSPAERADMVEHLSSISPWKPTEWLLDLYARIERGEPLPFGTRPDAANREGGDSDRIAAFLLGERVAKRPEGKERERLLVLRALAKGRHPAALPLFDRLATAVGTPPRDRGLVLRYLAANGQYSRAYRWIESQLMAELPRLPAAEARALIRDVAEVQGDESDEEDIAPWRADPHSAATWPELALSLFWYQVRTFGDDDVITFLEALRAIPVSDYRARPELTVALGADFDWKARGWALAELARLPRDSSRPASDGSDPGEDPALLPLRVLVSAWTAETDRVLLGAFCQGGERRRSVVLALGQWGDGLYESSLGTMAAVPGLSAEDRSWLLRAAIEMAARDMSESGSTNFLPDEEDRWLVTRLARGLPADKPVACPAPK